jgi:hypothetical protein
LSFFDEDDEPTRRQPRARRPQPVGPAAVDPQQLWVRRAIALGLGVLVLFLLLIAFRSCQDSAKKNALKDYNREVSALVQQSDTEIGEGFFDLLRQVGQESPEDLQTGISGFKASSEKLLEQAERVDVPDDMVPAHRSLLIAFELRSDALEYIAGKVAAATGDAGDQADEAVEQITGQMQAFLASDVLIQSRVTPLVDEALADAEVGGQDIVATAGFLPDIGWLEPPSVAGALGTTLSEGGTNRRPGQVLPGLHGTGLQSVSVGDLTLQAQTANKIPIGDDLTFAVKFKNQGEHDEFDVEVVVTLEPDGGGKAIQGRKTVDTIRESEEATANVTLPSAPSVGTVYTAKVNVKAVGGEEKTDNNRQSYPVLFTQGQ